MAVDVGGQRLVVEQVALLGAAARVADHAGGAAGEGDRPVPGVLEAAQHEQADQVADVQAVGGRIAAVVQRDRTLGEPSGQCGAVGALLHEAAGLEVGDQVGGHRSTLACRRDREREQIGQGDQLVAVPDPVPR